MNTGSEREQLEQCIDWMSKVAGARPAGSEANICARRFLSGRLREIGYEPEIQEYPCPDWSAQMCELEAGGAQIPVAANIFSPGCHIDCESVAVESPADLESADVAGRVVIVHGNIASWIFLPANFDRNIYSVPEQDALIAGLMKKQPAAVITINHYDGPVPVLIADSEFRLPSATVSRHAETQLLSQARLRLRIDSSTRESTGANVLAVKRGTGTGRIVLCAHYDTAHRTPGAMDNAAGAAALLLMCRKLATAKTTHDIEFVFFGGEDSWFPGDALYVKQHPAAGLTAAINFDGIGYREHDTAMALFNWPDATSDAIRRAASRMGGIVEEPFYESDHGFFWPLGIPTLALTSAQMMGFFGIITHTPNDTADLLDLDKIAAAVDLAYETVLLADALG